MAEEMPREERWGLGFFQVESAHAKVHDEFQAFVATLSGLKLSRRGELSAKSLLLYRIGQYADYIMEHADRSKMCLESCVDELPAAGVDKYRRMTGGGSA